MPRLYSLTAGSDYTHSFHAALARIGVEVTAVEWRSVHWLARTLRRGDVVNIHWPSFLYYFPSSRVLTWRSFIRTTLMLTFLRVRGIKLVWTAHNLYPHDGGRSELVHRLGRRLVVTLSASSAFMGRQPRRGFARNFRYRRKSSSNWIMATGSAITPIP